MGSTLKSKGIKIRGLVLSCRTCNESILASGCTLVHRNPFISSPPQNLHKIRGNTETFDGDFAGNHQ